jgi:hypothetical protein
VNRIALIAGCIAIVALAGAPASMAATADVQVPASDVYTGETATANQTVDSVASCTAPVLSSALSLLGDDRSYFPAPGADFESSLMTGWKLSGGASLVAGNEPFHVLGSDDSRSLRLRPGASATSPAFCVDVDYPTFRFFVQEVGTGVPTGLEVDVIYLDVLRRNVRVAGVVSSTGATDWTLSNDVPLRPQMAGSTGWRRVALRFRVASGTSDADWRIDDVLVDPACRY